MNVGGALLLRRQRLERRAQPIRLGQGKRPIFSSPVVPCDL